MSEKTTKKENLQEKPQKQSKVKTYFKNLPKRYFIDAFTGMAQGLFVTLIVGTIIKTLGNNVINKIWGVNDAGNFLIILGNVASILMGAGIGIGIAHYLKCNKMVVFACAVAGFMGAHSDSLMNGVLNKYALPDGMIATLSKGLPGNPIGAYVCALISAELGNLVAGKTKVDILVVPLVVVFSAFIGLYIAYPFVWLVGKLGNGIEIATKWNPFIMGVVISVIMGILLTMPTSSAAIWVAVAAGNSSYYMQLAGGAAVVGCACQMVGFAVLSFKDNGWGGIVSQGVGTSMLQIPNIMKKPILFIPPIIASAIAGPLATCLFKLTCTASGGGMGTSGFVGIFGTIEATEMLGGNYLVMAMGIFSLMIALPAVVCYFSEVIMRKKGWIKDGDLKI